MLDVILEVFNKVSSILFNNSFDNLINWLYFSGVNILLLICLIFGINFKIYKMFATRN